ncbi:chromosomal replication initiation ATPase DnaA [Lederbergia galactosidilyticus]|uniref:DnaA N-terminal domain-containing protein n=1 Tax=Lederbergia galactosidilytica TaxID=217031 RepID=UPI001AEB9BBD|nr:DnaA N-terminal domain-containing protein [Lederbergia galactosidilytica]MBP1917110.1 chromosomal replication initiation ATPase DnaA [Lederbergia galactosidilytica]
MDRDEAQELWEIVLQKVQQRLSKPMYDTWIAPLSGQIAEGNTIVINAASEFAKEWIAERYVHHFIAVLKDLTGQDFKVQVTYPQTKEERKESDPCSSISKEVINSNKNSSQVKYKKVSVKIPTITPSNHSIRLRKENERITRSLNLPLADLGLSHAEKRIYAGNERIREKHKCRENGIFGSFFRRK